MKHKDKFQHIIVSAGAYILIYWFTHNIAIASVLTALGGILKESYDWQSGREFCKWDLLADLIGIILGVVICG